MGGAASTACIFAGFADKLLKKVHHYFVNILCSTSAPRIVWFGIIIFGNCILTHNHNTYCMLPLGKLGFIKVLGLYIFCEKLAKQLRNK